MSTTERSILPTASTLLPPRILVQTRSSGDGVECSVHTLPKMLLREFRHVFQDSYLKCPLTGSNDVAVHGSMEVNTATGTVDVDVDMENATTAADAATASDTNSKQLELLAIPTNQKAREDLVGIGDHVEREKDRLLNVFMELGREICERIRAQGYWADFIDPCSGLPMLTQDCNKVYSEVDGMECLLNYKSYNAGFCKILTHPVWGSSVYPATIFTHCPIDVALEVVRSYPDA